MPNKRNCQVEVNLFYFWAFEILRMVIGPLSFDRAEKVSNQLRLALTNVASLLEALPDIICHHTKPCSTLLDENIYFNHKKIISFWPPLPFYLIYYSYKPLMLSFTARNIEKINPPPSVLRARQSPSIAVVAIWKYCTAEHRFYIRLIDVEIVYA